MRKLLVVIAAAVVLFGGGLTWYLLSDRCSKEAVADSATGNMQPEAAETATAPSALTRDSWQEETEKLDTTRRQEIARISEIGHLPRFQSYRLGINHLIDGSGEAFRFSYPLHLAAIRNGSAQTQASYNNAEHKLVAVLTETKEVFEQLSGTNPDAIAALQPKTLIARVSELESDLEELKHGLGGGAAEEGKLKQISGLLQEAKAKSRDAVAAFIALQNAEILVTDLQNHKVAASANQI